MRLSFIWCHALALIAGSHAKDVVVTVGRNTSGDATLVFQPSNIVTAKGDVVFFNFTLGNHTVTQSTFAAPCVPVHDTDITVNGFDSSFRDAGNETAITNLPITIMDLKTPIWFFDYNTCALGGVGVINANASSLETLEGFQRNAIRLNGSASSLSLSSTASMTRTQTTTAGGSTPSSNNVAHTVPGGLVAVIPFFVFNSYITHFP